MSRGAGAPRSGDATGELAQAADALAHQIPHALGGGDMSRGGRFGHSMSSRGIRTSLCITGAPRAARECERCAGCRRPNYGRWHPLRWPIPLRGSLGQRFGAPPRSGDATVRESLAATGKNFKGDSKAFVAWYDIAQRRDGGDRRRSQDADSMACGFCSVLRRRPA
jgi:hypothetical protein